MAEPEDEDLEFDEVYIPDDEAQGGDAEWTEEDEAEEKVFR
jgi:hypothetical protein